MVIMKFLQWVAITDDFMKMHSIGLDPWMRENAYKRVSFPLPDVVIRIALECEEGNIVARTRNSFILAHATVFRSGKSIGLGETVLVGTIMGTALLMYVRGRPVRAVVVTTLGRSLGTVRVLICRINLILKLCLTRKKKGLEADCDDSRFSS